jgi:hypothetical protein
MCKLCVPDRLPEHAYFYYWTGRWDSGNPRRRWFNSLVIGTVTIQSANWKKKNNLLLCNFTTSTTEEDKLLFYSFAVLSKTDFHVAVRYKIVVLIPDTTYLRIFFMLLYKIRVLSKYNKRNWQCRCYRPLPVHLKLHK